MPVTVGPGQIDLSVSMATTTQTSGWSISYQLVFCGGPRSISLCLARSDSLYLCLSLYLSSSPPLSLSLSLSLYFSFASGSISVSVRPRLSRGLSTTLSLSLSLSPASFSAVCRRDLSLSLTVTHQAFTRSVPRLARTLTCSPESPLPPSLRSSLGSLSHRNPRFSSFSNGFSKGKDQAWPASDNRRGLHRPPPPLSFSRIFSTWNWATVAARFSEVWIFVLCSIFTRRRTDFENFLEVPRNRIVEADNVRRFSARRTLSTILNRSSLFQGYCYPTNWLGDLDNFPWELPKNQIEK